MSRRRPSNRTSSPVALESLETRSLMSATLPLESTATFTSQTRPHADGVLIALLLPAKAGTVGGPHIVTGAGPGGGPHIAGDFNGDADVDGRDFLLWQRGGSPA